MGAGADFLIERIAVQGVRCDVRQGLRHLKIVVAQLTHVVELVGEERKSILVGRRVYGNPGEAQSLLSLTAVGSEPSFVKWIAVLDGVFQGSMPLPYLRHRLDTPPSQSPWKIPQQENRVN